MTKYDDSGYMADRPILPDQWKTVVPDMPHGVVIANNTVPPGILFIQNFLDVDTCDAIVAECDKQSGVAHTVMSKEGGLPTVQDQIRVSEMIDVRGLKTNVVDIVRSTFAEVVGPHFGKDIEWFELPEIIRYRQGGEYKPHADADNWDEEGKSWYRSHDRDLSILIYLNQEFTGGEIVFPNFGLSLPPKKGLMIAFPADSRYLHTARPVTSGVRYALVSWAAVKDGPRIHDKPRDHSIRM